MKATLAVMFALSLHAWALTAEKVYAATVKIISNEAIPAYVSELGKDPAAICRNIGGDFWEVGGFMDASDKYGNSARVTFTVVVKLPESGKGIEVPYARIGDQVKGDYDKAKRMAAGR